MHKHNFITQLVFDLYQPAPISSFHFATLRIEETRVKENQIRIRRFCEKEKLIRVLLIIMKKKSLGWSQEVLSMLLVQLIGTGLQLLSKVILNEGTFIFALLAYRNVLAALCLLPFAFFFERGSTKKLCCWSVWFWFAVNALIGIQMAFGLYYYGLKETTATYAMNFLNLIPITTFLLSVVTRMEELRMYTREGKLKSMGTILCVGGALIASLYKGESFHIFHGHTLQSRLAIKPSKPHWTLGTLMLVGSCLSYATWFIVQAKLLQVFPFKLTATMLTCIIASVQSTFIGLCIDRNMAAWRLGWNLQLITIIYSGVLASAVAMWLMSWAISRRGPMYPSMFNPLSLVFVAILEALILGQYLTLGILLGSIVMVVGLYSFLWAKTKEYKSLVKTNAESREGVCDASTNVAVAECNEITVIPTTSFVDDDTNEVTVILTTSFAIDDRA